MSNKLASCFFALGMVLLGLGARSAAEVVEIECSADTSLHEIEPDNNMGAQPHVAAGATAHADSMGQNPTRARGLIRFDLAGKIPAGAQVTSVRVETRVVHSPASPAKVLEFGLYRMNAGWVEGTKRGNLGGTATAGEPTWDHRAFPETWSAPGGAADAAATASSVQTIGGTGVYTFPSTPELLADVTAWLQNAEQNFGWMLRSDAGEQVTQSARRFGAREAGNGAKLIIEYSVAAAELKIESIQREGETVRVTWSGGTPPFQLEGRGVLNEGDWEDVGAATTENSAVAPFSEGTRFFRVRTE